MAEVLSYATPTTDGREVRRYDRWQARIAVAKTLRWLWLGIVALGFGLIALMWIVGDDTRDTRAARGTVLMMQMLLGGPVYVVVVSIGASGKIWPIPIAAIFGIAAFWVGVSVFTNLLFGDFREAGLTGLIWGVLAYLWFVFARMVGHLEVPVRPQTLPFDAELLGRVE